MRGPLRQLLIQGGAAAAVFGLGPPLLGLSPRECALYTGAVAGGLAWGLREPTWWRLIHAGFAPLAMFVSRLQLHPLWFLAAFGVLALIGRGAVSTQVPLFLSNRRTVTALETLLKRERALTFVDLGAGLGSTVGPLSLRLAEVRFTGVENSPATFAIGWLRTRGRPHLAWRFQDLFAASVAEADVVYAFLSPAPMAAVWEKVSREMRPGTLFVSNSFPVPGLEPDEVLDADSRPRRPLYCYRIRARAAAG